MDKVTQRSGEQGSKALRLHRPLVRIDEYAAREGVDVDQIEKCAEIGVIQLRKHQGKTYVVDIPSYSLEHTDEMDAEVASLLDSKSRSEVAQRTVVEKETKRATWLSQVFGSLKQTREKFKSAKPKKKRAEPKVTIDAKSKTVRPQTEQQVKPIEEGSISQLVDQMLKTSERIKARYEQHDKGQAKPKDSNGESCGPTMEVIKAGHQQLDMIETLIQQKNQQFNEAGPDGQG